MNNIFQIMKTGAGRYIQGVDAINIVGEELKRLGYERIGIITGNRAFLAVQDGLLKGLENSNLHYSVNFYSGYCTVVDIVNGIDWVNKNIFDCLLGVGGGKVLDYCKAIGAQVRIPVFMLPTIAATCAAFAPLSVIYDERGCQQKILFHDDSLAGVFVDVKVIANAPSRYLAAGIADSFAKYCEYTSMLPYASFNDMNLGRYIGASLASVSDEILFKNANKAYEANQANEVTEEFENVVTCIIGITGVVSGFGSFSKQPVSRFALAHGLNEMVRGNHIPDPTKFLHGEIVGVGILAQKRVNNQAEQSIKKMENLFNELGLPTRLSEIDINYNDSKFDDFVNDLIVHCHIDKENHERIYSALQDIR
ncbi:MAG: iron-containing alcohol dehydrogenase [Christensenellales bacterium]|jgi:glycerol dehydrogenase-like iron-containing ADH family enzyme